MGNRFCSKCGAPITPEARFCGNCGSAISLTSNALSAATKSNYRLPEDSRKKKIISASIVIGILGFWYLFIRAPSNSKVCKHLTRIWAPEDIAKQEKELPDCMKGIEKVAEQLTASAFKGWKKCAMKASTKDDVRTCSSSYGIK